MAHFNSQLDQFCDKLVQARKTDLAVINDNFSRITEKLNKLISEKYQWQQ